MTTKIVPRTYMPLMTVISELLFFSVFKNFLVFLYTEKATRNS
ncbi:unnamed protein product, partial [Larinioides sclopetarius]